MAPSWLFRLISQALALVWGYPIWYLMWFSYIKHGSMFHKGFSSMFDQSTMLLSLFHVPFPHRLSPGMSV